ncbi:MAG: HIT family protein [Alphaproteobacteria bacterium]|nr:HIT family protein [Alphaproteobacteria bacterium]
MAYDKTNIFARILRGELPAFKVYEDEASLAFLDIMPQAKGHTLVVPKAGAEGLLDIPPDALAGAMLTTQKVAAAVKRAVEAPGFMIAQLNGPAAGQTVFHIHFHIIPRWEGADFKLHAREKAPEAELKDIQAKIVAALG